MCFIVKLLVVKSICRRAAILRRARVREARRRRRGAGADPGFPRRNARRGPGAAIKLASHKGLAVRDKVTK
jgi:hypothetical protein